MGNVILRDFQERAVDAIISRLDSDRRSLLVMATGLGKTVVFGEIIKRFLQDHPHERVMVLAHREELVMQARKTIEAISGQAVAVEMGEQRSDESAWRKEAIVVSTVQTQCAGRGDRKRMQRFDAERFGLLIIDEAHHAVSGSYRKTLDHYGKGGIRLLGVTATPDRHDRIGLLHLFGNIGFEFGMREGIEGGWLVPIKQRVVNVQGLDFSACRTQAGDLHAGDLRRVVEYEQVLHGMTYPTIEIAGDRRCIAFCASIAHAERVAEIMNRHKGGSAAWVCGETGRDERRNIFRDFSSGRLQFLVNVGVATEGWDDAALDGIGVSLVAMMRPTKSRSLYCQCIGRATRPIPKLLDGLMDSGERRIAIAQSRKPAAIILDYCGNAGRHKLVHAADAMGESFSHAIQERANRAVNRQASNEEVDVLEALTRAEIEEQRSEERKKRKGIMAKAQYAIQDIDPFSLIDLAPDRSLAWSRGDPPSEKQIDFLRRLRIGIPAMMTKQEAGRLITAAIATPTPKQSAVLERHGFNPANFDRRSASIKLSEILGR